MLGAGQAPGLNNIFPGADVRSACRLAFATRGSDSEPQLQATACLSQSADGTPLVGWSYVDGIQKQTNHLESLEILIKQPILFYASVQVATASDHVEDSDKVEDASTLNKPWKVQLRLCQTHAFYFYLSDSYWDASIKGRLYGPTHGHA